MSSKKLLPIAAIAIIAVLIMIISENLNTKRPPESSLKFFSEKINSFIVKNTSGCVTLHKKGDLWFVSRGAKNTTAPSGPVGSQPDTASTDYPTDSASVAIALEKLTSLKKGDKVSANVEKQVIFEVDTAHGTSIEVFNVAGKSLGTIIIGKNTPDNNGNFVRMAGSNDVYNVAGNVAYSFFTDANRWRDKLMMTFDKALATSLTLIKKDGKTISITKADSGNVWNIASPEKALAKNDQVDGILSGLSRFSAIDFQDTAVADTVSGFAKPELVVTVGLKTGSKKITFGAKRADGKYFAMVDGKEQMYLVNDFDVNGFNKEFKDLKDMVPPVAAPAVKTAGGNK
jgi:hypothetical protein